MQSLFTKKLRVRIFAVCIAIMMAGIVIAAVQVEGFDRTYTAEAAAAALLMILIIKLKKSSGKSKGFRRAIRVLLHLVILLGTPVAAVALLQNFTLDPFRIYPVMFAVNAAFYYLIYFLFAGITGSLSAGFVTADVLFCLIGTANYFVVQFRGSPIVPWDLFSLGTAASVAGNYSYEITWRFVFSFAGFLALIVLNTKMTWKLRKLPVRILSILLTGGLIFGGVTAMQKKSIKEQLGMDMTLFTPNVRYRNNGFLAAFIGNLNLINIQEPDGYSTTRVEEIWSETSEKHANDPEKTSTGLKRYPNIIVVMDEAFSDLQVLGSFETSEDYMPNFRKIQNEGTGGHLMVSVKGGNTANTEYEFLTGDTMAFLPEGSVVYQQFVRDNTPTLASYLASQGYSTTAIHPYLATGWDRDRVYPLLGFQEFLAQDSFEDPIMLRNFISDQSAFEKIEECYEQKEDGPAFIFEVTMQNHSGYSKEYPGFSESIKLYGLPYENTQTRAVEKYLTLISETDKALGELIDYFRNVDEPTIIVMFGDHQPSDYITNVIDQLVGYEPESSIEEAQKSYEVPYLIWNNFGLEIDGDALTSANYLGAQLLKDVGIPLTAYQEFLLDLKEQIPVICAGAYVDQTGTYHSYDEDDQEYGSLLNEYNILEYNHMTDISHRVTEFFTKED